MTLLSTVLGAATVVVLSAGASGQSTTRVSVDSAGNQGLGGSFGACISPDGRFVAFFSDAANLVPNDTNGLDDLFVHDRSTGTTTPVSISSQGVQVNAGFGDEWLDMSGDGRFVVFGSQASTLVPGDSNGQRDVFVRDTLLGTTTRVSVDSAGTQGNGASGRGSISADGRFVTFHSSASNLVAGDTNGVYDVFLHDRQTAVTTRVSVDSAGAQANGESLFARLSADGLLTTFYSAASNLVAGDTNAVGDVFAHDRATGTTTRVSLGLAGNGGGSYSAPGWDGRFVAFLSSASDLVAGDTNSTPDVFVRDRSTGTTIRASVDAAGGQVAASDLQLLDISADGSIVLFQSASPNFVPGDTNGMLDAFARDLLQGQTFRANVDSSGLQANGACAFGGAVSADGRFIAFDSSASNLVPGDSNLAFDVFVREGGFVPPGTDLCLPGVSATLPCPCGNPPSAPPRGCDNSSATGGAQLTSAGLAWLSSDSLVFTTGGQRPTAMSVLMQGDAAVPSGAVFGQGVRCVAGSIKRLYVKPAVAGSIVAPDLGAGDAKVSLRSAALGDLLAPGVLRWYAVYYRDSTVLGACPTASTFNLTQTQRLSWGP